MSAFCGAYRPGGAPVERRDIDSMLHALDYWTADARGVWTGTDIGLGHLLLRTTPQSLHEALPLHDEKFNVAITGDFRLDNRTELGTSLGIPGSELADWADGRLVLRAYCEWGEECVVHLLGDFAFAVWDGQRRQLFCARDPFGVKPFYYYEGGGAVAFATEIKGLLALPFVDRSIDETWIGDYLHRMVVDRVKTFYARISRLAGGHSLTARAGAVRIRRYWEPDRCKELRVARDDDYIEAFREKLSLAVRRRLETPFEVGAELSGGLDSSGICAIAHHLLRDDGRRLHTFSQVRPTDAEDAEGLPEDAQQAIELLCKHSGITGTISLTGSGGILPTLEWAVRYCDEPPRNIVSLYNDQLYEAAAAKQVRVLLSGFGGNEGVSAAADDRKRDLLRSGRWGELWRELSAQADRQHAAAAWLRLLLDEFNHPVVASVLKRTLFWQRFRYRLAHDAFARRQGMWRRGLLYSRQQSVPVRLSQQPIYELALPRVAHRLEYGYMSTAARRIEYRYPLLDAELVSFYLAIPSHLKYYRGIGRYLFRRSLDQWVPDAVRWNTARRASANPGSVRRLRQDHPAMMARLRALPADHPVFRYVDIEKLSERVRQQGGFPRERSTALLLALMLAQKLSSIVPTPPSGSDASQR